MEKNLAKLEKILNFKFKNKDLLESSITHKSFNSSTNYEKLEFLGDRVLDLIISKKLLDLYPKENEGILDKKLASLVNKNKCYEVGKSLKLQNFILVGNYKKKTSITIENKIISDCCEALIGAVYLDRGFDFVEKFVLKIWSKLINNSKITLVDAKTRLQEYSLKNFKILPVYKLISNTGPRHKPNFKVAVKIKDSIFVESSGSSKKNAEQAAANKLLKNIKIS
tara:strand:+ start:1692 stop:2363 length:672 start_codon:yes stop_codon:yes gene_type:complete